MKLALVTGARGFLGRHFVPALQERGYDVEGCDSKSGDDVRRLFRTTMCEQYDLVVHCAAVEPNRVAIDSMTDHLAANLELDSMMFQWAYRTSQNRILYISSSAVYPAGAQTWSAQKAKLHEGLLARQGSAPFDDYGWLKLTGERMAAALNNSKSGFSVPVHVVRPFSGYGEDQSANFPFGAFKQRARAKRDPFEIWGDANQVRDWIHVSDVVNGALAIVDADVRVPVNLCTGVGTSMGRLAQLFAREAGYEPEIKVLTDKPLGVSYRVGNPYRMLQYYRPEVTIEEGVERAMSR